MEPTLDLPRKKKKIRTGCKGGNKKGSLTSKHYHVISFFLIQGGYAKRDPTINSMRGDAPNCFPGPRKGEKGATI